MQKGQITSFAAAVPPKDPPAFKMASSISSLVTFLGSENSTKLQS